MKRGCSFSALACCLMFLIGAVQAMGEGKEVRPDKVIQIKGASGFVEDGKEKSGEVAVVVGQTVRWQNEDDAPQTVTSDLKVNDKPIFDTGELKPGQRKDIPFDINLYEKAGGKRAGYVKLTYSSVAHPDVKGTIILLSPARRG